METSRLRKYFITGGAVLALILIVFAFLFWRRTHKSSSGSQDTLLEDQISDPDLKQAVTGYLESNVAKTGFAGKMFCSTGWSETAHEKNNLKVYSVFLCQEYYLGGAGEFESGTGMSGAVAMDVAKDAHGYKILAYRTPRDGADYAEDFLTIFPPEFRDIQKRKGQSALSTLMQGMDAENIDRGRAYFYGTDLSLNREDAINLVKMKYPELKNYPSDNLPPRSLLSERSADGWYLAFVQNGSGRAIISARCFRVGFDKMVSTAGTYASSEAPGPLTVSPRTCR